MILPNSIARIYFVLSRRWRYDARAFLYPLYDHDILNRAQAFSILPFVEKRERAVLRELGHRLDSSMQFADVWDSVVVITRRQQRRKWKHFRLLRDRPRQYLILSYFPAFSLCAMENCVGVQCSIEL